MIACMPVTGERNRRSGWAPDQDQLLLDRPRFSFDEAIEPNPSEGCSKTVSPLPAESVLAVVCREAFSVSAICLMVSCSPNRILKAMFDMFV
jgi:hypothetical protein